MQYVSYGSAPALQFGDTTDFSVAFWVRSQGFLGDPVLVGNKNWATGGNVGWTITGDSGGTWQWNYRGANGSRRDFDRAGKIDDGAWHLIAVSHDRDGLVRFYHDGQALTAGELASPGSIDALATAVGQDGTLAYGLGAQAEVDELRIWRRVLGGDEVALLWGEGPGARWRQLPGGSVGAGGVAELYGVGTLQSSATTSLVLNTHAGPTLAAIGFGTEPTHTPLLGATLVPLPFASPTMITDGSGTGSLSFPWAQGLPAGVQFWMQAWYLDPGSSHGLAASNALLATTP